MEKDFFAEIARAEQVVEQTESLSQRVINTIKPLMGADKLRIHLPTDFLGQDIILAYGSAHTVKGNLSVLMDVHAKATIEPLFNKAVVKARMSKKWSHVTEFVSDEFGSFSTFPKEHEEKEWSNIKIQTLFNQGARGTFDGHLPEIVQAVQRRQHYRLTRATELLEASPLDWDKNIPPVILDMETDIETCLVRIQEYAHLADTLEAKVLSQAGVMAEQIRSVIKNTSIEGFRTREFELIYDAGFLRKNKKMVKALVYQSTDDHEDCYQIESAPVDETGKRALNAWRVNYDIAAGFLYSVNKGMLENFLKNKEI